MSRFFACFLSPVLLALLATLPVTLHAASHATDKAKHTRPKYTENRDAPTILQAEQITGRPARDLYLDYEVEIERDQTLITGDHGIFRQEENEAEIIGNVFIQRFGDQYVADSANLNLETGEVIAPSTELFSHQYNLTTPYWAGDSKAVYFEYNERFYKELPAAGINFPFPQMDVHVKNE